MIDGISEADSSSFRLCVWETVGQMLLVRCLGSNDDDGDDGNNDLPSSDNRGRSRFISSTRWEAVHTQ